MANNLYTKKVIKHFKNPHNYGRMRNPDGIGKAGNPVCGDELYLYIKVDRNEVIKGIRFETIGCAAAIAVSSILTDLAKGKNIKQALKIDNKKIVRSLGGLPAIKHHCSLIGVEALRAAIYDYLSKKKIR